MKNFISSPLAIQNLKNTIQLTVSALINNNAYTRSKGDFFYITLRPWRLTSRRRFVIGSLPASENKYSISISSVRNSCSLNINDGFAEFYIDINELDFFYRIMLEDDRYPAKKNEEEWYSGAIFNTVISGLKEYSKL